MSLGWRQRAWLLLRSPGRIWYAGFAGFLVLTLAGIGTPESEPAPAAAPAPERFEPANPDQSYPPAAPAHATIADAVTLVESARESSRDVRDYTCRLVQRERVGDKLPPETVMEMQVRARPFAVHLKWLEPRSMAGQEAVYAAGKNNGRMRVRGAGLLGAVGFISLDVDDPRARRSSRHNITEAGLGNLIEQFDAGWHREAVHGGVEVKIADFTFAGRPCTRVETIHSANPDGFFLFSRSVVYFDNTTHLPIRVENYAWPKQSDGTAELLEEYSYLDLQMNPGLNDNVFDH